MPRDDRFQDITIKDFSLGVNQEADTTQLQPNEFASCVNFVPSLTGSITKRLGYSKYNSTDINVGYPPRALLWFESAGTDLDASLVAVVYNQVFDVATSGASTDLGIGAASNYTLPADAKCRMIQYKNRIYGSAWKGTSSSRMFCVAENCGAAATFKAWRAGVHPPDVAPILAQGSAVGLTGTYKYVISYFYGESSAHGESNASASATITVTNKKVTVTLLGGTSQPASWNAANDLGIDKIRIYRTEAGGSDYYYLTETTSATSYTDSTADASLDTDTIPQTDNYPTPEGLNLLVASSRLLVLKTYESSAVYPHRVRWSLPGYPDIFPAQNYHDFPAEMGEVTGACELAGTVYVFQEFGCSALNIQYGSEYTVQRVSAVQGPIADSSPLVQYIEASTPCVMFTNGLGFTRFDGSSASAVGYPVYTYRGRLATGLATWDGQTYYCACWDGGGFGEPREVRYDTWRRRQDARGYTTGSWWPQKTANYPYCYTAYGSTVYFGDASTGFVYRYATASHDTTDSGTAIVATLTSGDIDFGMPTMQKRLVKILVEAELDGAATFTWTTDFGVAPGKTGSFALSEGATATTPVLTEFDIPGWVDFRRLRYSITTSASVATTFTLHSVTFRIGATRPE